MEYILIIALAISVYLYLRSHRRIQQLISTAAQLEDRLEERSEAQEVDQAKLDAVLSSMFEGILVIDAKGRIILINPSLRKTFLIDAEPFGKRPIEIIRNAAIQDIVDRSLRRGAGFNSEEIVLTIPEEKYLQVNAAQIGNDEEIQGLVLVFHDITELRRLERVRQDFVANVSHELRTPVASIRGYAETLIDGALDDKENLRKFVEIIHRDSERLTKLIDDLLDLARIESGKMKMVLLPVDMFNLVKRTASILEPLANAKSISIQLDIPQNFPNPLADETRLSQVMLNLMDNAIKYTQERGLVTVSAEEKDQSIQVSISDTGMGIPEKDLSRVFERFYRVDRARSRELGGTGLGLSIVKHIVQAHGGEIWVKSQLDQGAVFSFTIPKV